MPNDLIKSAILRIVNNSPGVKEIDIYRKLMTRELHDEKREAQLEREIDVCGNLYYVIENMVFEQSIQELIYVNPNRPELKMRLYFPVSYTISTTMKFTS